MKNRVLNWLARSKLGEVYLTYLLWKQQRELELQLEQAFNGIGFANEMAGYHQEQQDKLSEGIYIIKKEIKKYVKDHNSKEYERVLGKIKNLVPLANGSNSTEAKIKRLMFARAVHDIADIKSPKDKEDMVEDRIKHYQELQKHKLERDKRRQERRNNGKNS